MDVLTLITTFMLSVGSPTWVVNYYNPTATSVEVDVQTTTDPILRYLLLIEPAGVTQAIQVPADETQCQRETT